MRTTIEMAREAAGDDWGLFQEYMPEIHRLVELVRADERARMAEQPAQQEPWEHLKAYGYAPGGYMMTCRGCNSTVTGVDKRASRCMPCATKAAEQPAQQEPVAWATQIGEYAHIKWGAKRPDYPIRYEVPLYTSPQPCPTCEALARTVMLDQTSHDTHRKPTDEMVVAAARVLSDRQAAACNVDCGDMWKLHGNDFIDDARAALEASHGIREKK